MPTTKLDNRLQWGRGFAATEGRTRRKKNRPPRVLQWGRGFAATEGCRGRADCSGPTSFNGAVASQPRKVVSLLEQEGRTIHASMGPWLRSHGRGRWPPPTATARGRFNGAVASQPRKGGKWPTHSVGPARFNGAVASQPRKAALRPASGGGPRGFNGAVASQPRKGPSLSAARCRN